MNPAINYYLEKYVLIKLLISLLISKFRKVYNAK